MKYTLLFIALTCGFLSSVAAQTSASASVSANVVTPIQIVKNSDIDFGSFATNGGVGTLVLGADVTGGRVASSNITMPNGSAINAKAAGFTITGQNSFAYNLILPTTDYLIYNGESTMVVNGFTSSASKVISSEEEIIYLGATLNVDADQPVGTYTSAGSVVEVIVNYN